MIYPPSQTFKNDITIHRLTIYLRSYSVAIPALILSSINAYNLWNEHWEHESHLPPQEERPQYPYLNIRVKRFPWGDGDKTLFWNDNVNYKKADE
ncbi:Cytochrome c oxidase subunit 6A, mitochondrial [Orbilia oligospora]|uniref:Cytochrome c oxidase subunit n=1 Tax=Orbilia oligospora TaxID=2813651 RepID=A0A7C8NIP5_ORBOL|nr:Cytochrome c oxidase subunit 6A, mitochondrial [Orbilia oligospora]KAF3103301.1 Cytochrome c oxidase subunit 6A, mitochondrial [Orbilia oligospora]KAF3103987.1 Cytochrome c oxidase subunit 6A, mitochondrial [Orbilia oligospora]KAF3138030.1 Cytochrome c oxidase subunit 6A, mitochondrial [Orbilia oligospora]KAF3151260.1 Cytochrome c oxidase subunit 6A, mitochondrial [Orbilia oligospora]